MIAINGPMQGKHYRTSDITHTVIDHVRDAYNIFEVTYYRTKNGWAFHSWKRMY
jgi:hypothetical protein